MAYEIIGGVAVEIVGDYSKLQSDMDAAVGIAQSGSSKISDAIESAFQTPDSSPITTALEGIATEAQQVAQKVAEAFSDVQIQMPSGSIISDSAAADIAKEIATAFESNPISLNIDTSTAGSAAQEVAGEIAAAFAQEPLTVDTSEISSSLANLVSAAEADAAQITSSLSDIQAPDLSGLGGGISSPALDISAAEASLQQLEGDAQQTVDTINQDFAGQSVPPLDVSAPEASLASLDDCAQTAMDTLAQDVSGVAVPPLDVSQAEDSLTGLDTAAQTAMDAVSQDVAGIAVPAIDTTAAADSLTALDTAAQQAGEAVATDLGGISIPAPDVSGAESAFQAVEADAQQAGQAVDSAFGGAVEPPDFGPVTNAFNEALADAQTAGQQLVADLFSSGEVSTAAQAMANDVVSALDQINVATGQSSLGDYAQQLQGLMEAAQSASPALQQVGDDSLAAAQQMSLFGDAIDGVAPANATGQLNLFSDAIEITSDDCKSVVSAAQDAAGALGDLGNAAGSVESGLGNAEQSLQQFSEAAQKVIDAQKQADDELAQAKGVLAELQSAYDHGQISAETLARAEQDVANAVNAANPALRDSASAAEQAAQQFGGLVTQIGALVGISVSIAGFKQLADSMAEAADTVTRAQIALTALTGDAEQASSTIERLEQLGVSDGLSMPGLIQAAQSMTALLPEGADVVGILNQLADASAVTGKSVDALSNTFDRIVNATTVSGRQLAQLGLNMNDLKTAMEDVGASFGGFGDNIQKAFGALDQHDKIIVLRDALSSLQGVAADVADNTFAGKWHQAAAQWDIDLARMGEGMKDFTSSMDGLKSVVDGIAVVLTSLGSAAKATGDTIGGVAAAIVNAIKGIWDVLLSTNATDGWNAMKDGFSNTWNALKSTWDSVTGDFQSGAKTIDTVLGNTGQAILGTGEYMRQAAIPASSYAASLQEVDNKGKSVIDTAMKMGQAFQQVSTFESQISSGAGVQQLQKDFENVSKAIDTVAKVNLPEAIQAVDDYTAAQLRNGAQATVILDAWSKESTLIDKLAKESLPQAVAAMSKWFDVLSQGQAPTSAWFDALTKDEQLIDKLGKENLPQAEAAWDGLIKKLEDSHAPLDVLNKALQDHIDFLQKAADAANKHQDAMIKLAEAYSKFNLQGPQATQAIKDQTALLQQLGIIVPPLVQPMSDLNKAMSDLGVSANTGQQGMDKLGASVKDLHTPITQLTDDLGKMIDAAKNSGDWSAVDTAVDNFDKRIQVLAKDDLPEAVKEMFAWIDAMQQHGAPAALVQSQVDKLGSLIQKMAQDQLPGAQDAWKKYLDVLSAVPKGFDDIVSAQQRTVDMDKQKLDSLSKQQDAYGATLLAAQKYYQDSIKLADLQGKSDGDLVLSLEAVRLKYDALQRDSHGFADAEVKAIGDIIKGFDQLGQTMADAIVNGKNLGDALVGQFKKIATTILGDLIQGALQPMISSLEKGIANMIGLQVQTTGATAAQGGLAASAGTASGAMTTLTTTTGAATGALASLAVIIGAVAAVIGAISSIIEVVVLYAIDDKLFHIETSLLEIRNETENRRKDAWDQFNQTYDRMGEQLDRLNHLMDDVAAIRADIESGAGVGQGGGNQQVQSDLDKIAANSDSLVTSCQSIDDDIQRVIGAISSLDTDLNSLATEEHSDLMVVNASVLQVISSLIYGVTQHSNDIANQSSYMANSYSAGADNVARAVQHASDVNAAGLTNSSNSQVAAIQAAGESAFAAAMTVNGQIQALGNEYQQLMAGMNAALAAGNLDLANAYKAAAGEVQLQLNSIIEGQNTQTGQITQVITGETASQTSAYQSGTATIVSGIGQAGANIVSAVNNAAVNIANAVVNANSTQAYANPGQGTTTYVPPKGSTPASGPGSSTYTPPPSQNAQTAPGAAPPPSNYGAYTQTTTPNYPSNPNSGTQWQQPMAPDNSLAGHFTGTPAPDNSSNPNNRIPGAAPYGGATPPVPQYQTGGMVDSSGLLAAEKGEAVLTPEETDAVTLLAMQLANLSGGGGLATAPVGSSASGAAGGDYNSTFTDNRGYSYNAAAAQADQINTLQQQLIMLQNELTEAQAFGRDTVQVPELEAQIAQVQDQLDQLTGVAQTQTAATKTGNDQAQTAATQAQQGVSQQLGADSQQISTLQTIATGQQTMAYNSAALPEILGSLTSLQSAFVTTALSFGNAGAAGSSPTATAPRPSLPSNLYGDIYGYGGYYQGGPLPQYDSGGLVGQDQVAMVHAGEFVIPPSGMFQLPVNILARLQLPPQLPQLPSLPFVPPSGGGGQQTVMMNNNFYGVTTARDIAQQLQTLMRTAGVGRSFSS